MRRRIVRNPLQCVQRRIRRDAELLTPQRHAAQTDMRMHIQYALTYPDREASNDCALDWSALKRLDFEAVPPRKFRCFELAYEAARQGGPLPCALNAADEIAVAAFLDKKLPFLEIGKVIERVLEKMPRSRMGSIDDVLAADAEARRLARQMVDSRKR